VQRDDVIATVLWLFIPTVVGAYTHDLRITLVSLGVATIFMPLQLWVVAKCLWYLIAWFYRLAKRKAGEVTGGVVPTPESMAGIVYPRAEGVRVLPEGESDGSGA
jgi:hypothetical protein